MPGREKKCIKESLRTPEGKINHEKPRHRWNDNVKADL
jgi:hypothetical protein